MDWLTVGPEDAPVTILLAHGAGAPMDSGPMTAVAEAMAAEGLRVVRFEFGYMAARRQGGRRPPPRAEMLIPEYRAAIAALDVRPLVIGRARSSEPCTPHRERRHAAAGIWKTSSTTSARRVERLR